MRNKDKPWFVDLCRHAVGLKQEAIFGGHKKPHCSPSVSLVSESWMFLVYCVRLEFVIASACQWGWWWISESVGMADLLYGHFDGKQSRESVDLPLTCRPSPRLITIAFWSREVRHLLSDLESYGGTDPLGMFPFFLKRIADILAPRLGVVFRRLVCLFSFTACWRQANATPFPKDPPSSSFPITNRFL